jgi:hypothetical protein
MAWRWGYQRARVEYGDRVGQGVGEHVELSERAVAAGGGGRAARQNPEFGKRRASKHHGDRVRSAFVRAERAFDISTCGSYAHACDRARRLCAGAATVTVETRKGRAR